MKFKFFLVLAFFISSSSFSFYDDTYVDKLKSQLQKELKSNYLLNIVDTLGACQDDPLKCLMQVDDVVTFQTKSGSICFPYTECGYYKCMEEKYKCKSVGVNYFADLAYPTCKTYEKNIKKRKFTKKGREWVYNVMVCLQKGLTDECEVNGNCSTDPKDRKKTCEHITEFTLNYHPGCYIHSGIGVCHLPMSDKINIWRTVSPYLTQREREEAYNVVFYCATH